MDAILREMLFNAARKWCECADEGQSLLACVEQIVAAEREERAKVLDRLAIAHVRSGQLGLAAKAEDEAVELRARATPTAEQERKE